MARLPRRLPAWLLGFLIAAVVFVAILFIVDALGYGDDPVVDSIGIVSG